MRARITSRYAQPLPSSLVSALSRAARARRLEYAAEPQLVVVEGERGRLVVRDDHDEDCRGPGVTASLSLPTAAGGFELGTTERVVRFDLAGDGTWSQEGDRDALGDYDLAEILLDLVRA